MSSSGIGLFHGIYGNEIRTVASRDSNLLTNRATYGFQLNRVCRAAFRLILQIVLLRQTELQYLCGVFSWHNDRSAVSSGK